MPFIGKDWRSPGEAWVKTESLGWQRMKIIESHLHPGCHQSPACSWPPRSEFGKHMANNCAIEQDKTDVTSKSPLIDSISISSESSSSDNSRSASQSPSPTNSPEKTLSPHQHHLHPITISSPYGKYSCCSHHLESNPSYYSTNVQFGLASNAQSMPRSLSKESMITSENKENTIQPKMRYNNSVSDFRSSSCPTENQFCTDINNTFETSASQNCDKMNNAKITRPILTRNGSRMCETELSGTLTRSLDSINTNENQMRAIINSNNCCCNSYNQSPCCVKKAPHCRVSVRTREVVMYNTISEAFYSLDFCNAIHDIRRFGYICKLLHLLITQNLTSLSGCATKVLFTMLEQVAWEVSSNKRNIHILKNLLNELKIMIQKNYCWGRPIGSSLLWQQHFDTIERISQIVNGIELSPPKSETKQTTFNDLPVEMVREILLRLNDYRDLINSAQASPVMRTMIDSQHIWHKLCKYHFTEQQLKLAIEHNHLFTKRGNNRGLKYARTVSADGKTSYRNPVMHKSKYNSSRQQLEQTKSRRSGRSKDHDRTDESKASYVTRAIKIFDSQGSSTSNSNFKEEKPAKTKQLMTEKGKEKERGSKNNDKTKLNDGQPPTVMDENVASTNHLSREIDWERIFHQLRKHCRCLFWRSFGHPCIKNDENSRVENQERSILSSNNKNNGLFPPVAPHNVQQDRPSVAMLSRSFDNRAQGSVQNIASANYQNNSHNPVVRNPLMDRNNLTQRDGNGGVQNDNETKQKVLVPKHVAISPQAFLKFFSL